MNKLSLCVAVIALSLAACSKPSPQTASETSAIDSIEAPSLSEETPAVPNPLSLKAGLWQVTYARPEMGYESMQKICIDAAAGKTLAERNDELDPMTCSRHDISVRDGGTHIERVCTHNDTTVTSHIDIRIDNENAFRQTMETIYDPAFAGHADTHTSADGVWQGACPAGMKLGDIMMADGSRATLR